MNIRGKKSQLGSIWWNVNLTDHLWWYNLGEAPVMPDFSTVEHIQHITVKDNRMLLTCLHLIFITDYCRFKHALADFNVTINVSTQKSILCKLKIKQINVSKFSGIWIPLLIICFIWVLGTYSSLVGIQQQQNTVIPKVIAILKMQTVFNNLLITNWAEHKTHCSVEDGLI